MIILDRHRNLSARSAFPLEEKDAIMSHALDLMAIMALCSCLAAAEPAADGYRNLRRHPDAVTVITETGTVDLVARRHGRLERRRNQRDHGGQGRWPAREPCCT